MILQCAHCGSGSDVQVELNTIFCRRCGRQSPLGDPQPGQEPPVVREAATRVDDDYHLVCTVAEADRDPEHPERYAEPLRDSSWEYGAHPTVPAPPGVGVRGDLSQTRPSAAVVTDEAPPRPRKRASKGGRS